ncbi:MAG: phosphoesterase PA-phosphatase, partial [Gammaproteobacteria bacterium]|nr:phosphoesterase PA-phosphatase [Gammaproteobacteria bacterium]
MSNEFITSILLAVQQHPYIALIFVYLIAFSESLIVIGLIVPGAILMVLFGALIATGALDFWLTIALAALGA